MFWCNCREWTLNIAYTMNRHAYFCMMYTPTVQSTYKHVQRCSAVCISKKSFIWNESSNRVSFQMQHSCCVGVGVGVSVCVRDDFMISIILWHFPSFYCDLSTWEFIKEFMRCGFILIKKNGFGCSMMWFEERVSRNLQTWFQINSKRNETKMRCMLCDIRMTH